MAYKIPHKTEITTIWDEDIFKLEAARPLDHLGRCAIMHLKDMRGAYREGYVDALKWANLRPKKE
ncbi:hypothetical protein LCGC14_1776810 [marine sediment metagenome]|uniref:Uncharacterized protein n=1 Tax=marine sediment metagenome TaxID=412755 RepID=A0A0F9GWI5_9ZZZZ